MTTGTRTLDELLFHFKTVARKGPTDWDRKFARSILRNAKRPDWTPSARQLHVMEDLVSRMFGKPETAPEIDLIERDEGEIGSAAV